MESAPIEELKPGHNFAIPAKLVLLLLVLAIFMGYLLGGAVSALVAYASHREMASLLSGFGENSPYADRQMLRWVSLLSHFVSFTVPALFVAIFLYRKNWLRELRLHIPPKWKAATLSILFILVSFPFAQSIYWLNRHLPLPEWMSSMEGDVSDLIKGLMVMNSPGELLFNLLVVAIAPAIGEELVFRGFLQRQFYRLVPSPGMAVWITAFLFSAIHLQFEGFLPRLMLGAMLGYLFLWSKNLWIPILAHFFFNGIQVLGQYFAADKLEALDTAQSDNPHWVAGIISLILMIMAGYSIYRYFVLSDNQEDIENEPSL